MQRFNKKLLRKNDIQFFRNIKDLTKAVTASQNLLLVLPFIRKRLLIHFSHKQKFIQDQFILLFHELNIISVFQSDVTTDRADCKIEDKRNPVRRFVEKCRPADPYFRICCQQ